MADNLSSKLRFTHSTKLAKYLDDHGISDIEGAARMGMFRNQFTLYRANGIFTKKCAKKFAKAFCENDYRIFLESRNKGRVFLDYDI